MSIRFRTRTDGSTYTQVRYRINGRAGSVSFDDHAEALQFDDLICKVGAAKALEITKIVVAHDSALTVGRWLEEYNDTLSGLEEATVRKYRSYAAHDFDLIADMPLAALTEKDVAIWIDKLRNRDGSMPSGKTVANKHGYLAGALNVAVRRGHLRENPCDTTTLPAWDREEMCFLEPEEYQLLHDAVSDHWQPLVQFLVMSGARWSEATALKPSDVNRKAGTVRISRAWKKVEGGYKLGVPKTRKSVRTIDVDAETLERLDYSGEWLFTNSGKGGSNSDGVVRIHNFRPHVWVPALARAAENGLTKTPRVHDLRHTCASWLIQAGRPLPAVQEQMGHESILTTVGIYNHLNRDSGKENAAALAAMLKTSTTTRR